MSVYEWIESRVPGGHDSPLGRLLDVAYNIEYGAETTDQSALNLVYLLGYQAVPGNYSVFGASDERYHIVGGNTRLPLAVDAIVSAQGAGAIRNGWRMTSIKRELRRHVRRFGSTRRRRTEQVVADHVVLALPFAVLRTLDYRGPTSRR